jgi:hypothetical protein
MAMITITLEGECWRDILREMSIIEASVRGSRIEDLPDEGIVAPDERFCLLERLSHVLGDYGLGPEERAEILGRVRQ